MPDSILIFVQFDEALADPKRVGEGVAHHLALDLGTEYGSDLLDALDAPNIQAIGYVDLNLLADRVAARLRGEIEGS